MAEGGDTAPLTALLNSSPGVHAVTDSGGLLDPLATVTVMIEASGAAKFVSVVAMLIPTNDAFFAVQRVRLPRGNSVTMATAIAYDAGSEPNDELCANIPGPVCGGVGASPGVGGEGAVHVHAGIHGIGTLVEEDRDWRNPVARIVIHRVKNGHGGDDDDD